MVFSRHTLTSCTEGEEVIRAQSKDAAQASETLLHHFNMVAESMNLLLHFSCSYQHRSEEQLIVQLLGIRLFNGSASAVHHMLAGYYQNSVMQQRDLLEVSFLLDYFRTDRALILEWKAANESQRNQKFGAFQVRTALDDRDGFTERKREKHYKLLCSHRRARILSRAFRCSSQCPVATRIAVPTSPNAHSMRWRRSWQRSLTWRPAISRCFSRRSRSVDRETKLHFMEKQATWFEAFYVAAKA